jgi:drug/metabolite transporter (DMT)-like permease
MKVNHVSQESNAMKGILYCIVAYFSHSFVGLCGQEFSHPQHLPVILFFQSIVCALLSFSHVKKCGFKPNANTSVNLYVWRIILGLVCYLQFFYLLSHISIAESLVFQYTGGLWVPLISLLWFGLAISPLVFFIIFVGFVGVFLQMQFNGNMSPWLFFNGVSCGLLQGITLVQIRKLTLTEPSSRIIFYFFTLTSIVMFPFAFPQLSSLHLGDFLLLLAIGLLTYVGQVLITQALKYAHAVTLAPLAYLSIFFGGLFDWFVFQKIPSERQLLGIVLIVVAGLMIIYIKTKRDKGNVLNVQPS